MIPNGKVSMDPAMYKRALRRECIEETDIDIDTLTPNDVYELPSVTDQPSDHKNFVIFLRNPLKHAYPQPENKWEMKESGVAKLLEVTSVKGGYHAWAPLHWLVTHLELMEPCREVIRLLINTMPSKNLCPWSKKAARSSVNSVTARVCSVNTGNSSSASSKKVSSKVEYAKNFQALELKEPIMEKPFDVIRNKIGRQKKVGVFREVKN